MLHTKKCVLETKRSDLKLFDKFLPDAPDVESEGGGPVGGGGGGVSELAGASIEAALKKKIMKLIFLQLTHS